MSTLKQLKEMVHTVLPPKNAPADMPPIIRNGENATGQAHFTFGYKQGEAKGNRAKFSSVGKAVLHFMKHGHGNVVDEPKNISTNVSTKIARDEKKKITSWI